MGKPGFPTPRSGGLFHLSRPCDSRTPPDEHRLGARAARPRRVSAGKVTAPLPSPPPAGWRESGASPQRGEVGRGGQRRMRVGEQPMFTVAVHAAPPHNAAMNIRLFLGGRSPPKPSRGWEHGETRFPHAPRRGLIFTLGSYAGASRRGGGLPGPGGYGRIYLRAVQLCALQMLPAIVPSSIAQ